MINESNQRDLGLGFCGFIKGAILFGTPNAFSGMARDQLKWILELGDLSHNSNMLETMTEDASKLDGISTDFDLLTLRFEVRSIFSTVPSRIRLFGPKREVVR
jgi:hypothetical protein